MDEQMNQGPSMENQSTPAPVNGKNGSNALTIVVIIIILVIAAFLLWRYLPASDDAVIEENGTEEVMTEEETNTGDVQGEMIDSEVDVTVEGAVMEETN